MKVGKPAPPRQPVPDRPLPARETGAPVRIRWPHKAWTQVSTRREEIMHGFSPTGRYKLLPVYGKQWFWPGQRVRPYRVCIPKEPSMAGLFFVPLLLFQALYDNEQWVTAYELVPKQ